MARPRIAEYDALSQKEFYRLFAYFNNIDESGRVDSNGNAKPVIRVPVKETLFQIQNLQQRLAECEADWAAVSANVHPRDDQTWENQMRAGKQKPPSWGTWKFLGPIPADSVSHGHNKQYGPERVGDASLTYGDKVWEDKDWIDSEVIKMPLPPSSVGFVYRQIVVEVPTLLELVVGADDAVHLWLNGAELFEKTTVNGAEADQETITLELSVGMHDLLMKISNRNGSGGFYFKATHQGLRQDIADILAMPKAERTPEQQQRLTELYRESRPQWRDLTYRIRRLKGRLQKLGKESHVETMVMRERVEPRETYVLVRGRYDNPDKSEKLFSQVPDVFPKMPEDAPVNRLGLAHWLFDVKHPLTARVAVNRYWQSLFGIGLVATSEDFGSQGDPPSHPELLDWLATEFVRRNWDRKALLRRVMTSQTYRQSSRMTAEAFQWDPQNRLLGRGPRFRLPVQVLRDQALAMSGLLVERIGGPSVKPYPKRTTRWRTSRHRQCTAESSPTDLHSICSAADRERNESRIAPLPSWRRSSSEML